MLPAPAPTYDQVARFCRDLARMYRSNMRTEAIFEAASRNTYSPSLAALANFVADEIASGRTVSSGFRCFESVLRPSLVRIVEAAEGANDLGSGFEQIAEAYEEAAADERRSKLVKIGAAILGGAAALAFGITALVKARPQTPTDD